MIDTSNAMQKIMATTSATFTTERSANSGLGQRQQIIHKASQHDKAAADGEEGQAEGLENEDKGEKAQPDDGVFEAQRRTRRHACLEFIAHARTALPFSPKKWVCFGSGFK